MTPFKNRETPTARRKRKKVEEDRRKAERERIFDNGVWWAGFFGWHLASGIWIALLLVVLFIEFWIGVARGFYDEFKTLKQAWREREKEDCHEDEPQRTGNIPGMEQTGEGKPSHSGRDDQVDHLTESTKCTTPSNQAKLYLLPAPKN